MGFVSLEFIRMVEPENIEELRSQCELNQTVSICQTFRNQKEIRTKEIDGGYLGQFGVAVTKYPKLGTLLKKKKSWKFQTAWHWHPGKGSLAMLSHGGEAEWEQAVYRRG